MKMPAGSISQRLRAATLATVVSVGVTGCLQAGEEAGEDFGGETSESADPTATAKAVAVKVTFTACNNSQTGKVNAAFVKAVNAFSAAQGRSADDLFKQSFGNADLAQVKSRLNQLYQPFYNGIFVKCGCVNPGRAVARAPVGFNGGTISLCPAFFDASTAQQAGALVHEVSHAYLGLTHSAPKRDNPFSYQSYITALAK